MATVERIAQEIRQADLRYVKAAADVPGECLSNVEDVNRVYADIGVMCIDIYRGFDRGLCRLALSLIDNNATPYDVKIGPQRTQFAIGTIISHPIIDRGTD